MNLKTKNNRIIKYIGITFFLTIIIRRAWVCDDAFITFRTVDNFINGYGLTWNIVERVQAYTHPLWMFLVSFFYLFTHEPFYTVLFISILLSFCTIALFLKYFSPNTLTTILIVTCLSFSRAYVDYSTSGLENPLSYFFIILFFIYKYWGKFRNGQGRLFSLSLIASFGILNRMDLFLVFAPAMIHEFWRFGKIKGIIPIIIGQLPFILWEFFSLTYYGYLFPNTAYAKLAHGVSRMVIIRQGITYLYHSIINDTLTILVIVLGIIIPILHKDNRKMLPISIGTLLYLCYTIWIGGDFMSGRFFTIPFLTSFIVVVNAMKKTDSSSIIGVIAIMLFLGLALPFNTFTLDIKEITYASTNVDDERYYFFPGMSLVTRYQNHMQPEFKWKDQGLEYIDSGIDVTHARAIGLFGYYAGPDIYIIDGHGLADPLLSHLHSEQTSTYMSGHIVKDLPDGYRDSLPSNLNQISDPNIREYYEKVRIITRGDIFDWERFETIINMNLGKYQAWIE